MTTLDQYQDQFSCIRISRDENGILLIRLHREDETLRWNRDSHLEVSRMLPLVASDPDNRVVIITGTGEYFTKFELTAFGPPIGGTRHGHTAQSWDPIMSAERSLMSAHLSIPVPVIAAVNGPAHVHADIALLSDVVLATPRAHFADESHFWRGIVPGDGVHVVWPALLGPNLGRYFLMAGKPLEAEEALSRGLIGEIVEDEHLLDRAYEIARKIAAYPDMNVRYTRDLLTRRYRRLMADELGYGLTLQGLSAVAAAETNRAAEEAAVR
ncbi:enoyl-CoA hydratase/isomerase family protein [Streptomyces chartreusis]|uniref:enoyl-CoA hydratase/isomerase family protein n=1 Tax=Streptomyces chartreusis TaxID=1969 RepID=UPI00363ED7FC